MMVGPALTRRRVLTGAACAGTAACMSAPIGLPMDGASLPLDTDAAGRLYLVLETPPHGAFRFLLDTGSSVSAAYDGMPLAAALHRPGGTRRVWGLGGASRAASVAFPAQGAGGLMLPPRGGIVLPAPKLGRPADGLIGMDVLGDRAIGVDRANGRLVIGAPGVAVRTGGRWDRVPLAALSALPGGRSLLFAQTDVGRERFPALIDLGSDSSYFSWTVAEASTGLRRLRRSLSRGTRVEGAVAAFRPKVRVEVSGFALPPHRWNRVEVTIREVPSEELLGPAGRPIVVAGMNLFAGRNFLFDAPGRALYLRRADRAEPRPAANPLVRFPTTGDLIGGRD